MRKRLTAQAILELLQVAWRRQSTSMRLGGREAPQEEEMIVGAEIWKTLSSVLPNAQERRLAYLLFHCGLSAEEIVQHCPLEFGDIREVYQLRCIIMQRVLCNADQFSHWLAHNEESL